MQKLVLPVLLLCAFLSNPAGAQVPTCLEKNSYLQLMARQYYVPMAEMELEHKPAIIMASVVNGDWIVLLETNDTTLCEIAHGRGFRFYRQRAT